MTSQHRHLRDRERRPLRAGELEPRNVVRRVQERGAERVGDGEGEEPPMQAGTVPPSTSELVLIVSDPDAPGDTYVHVTRYGLGARGDGAVDHGGPTSSPALGDGVLAHGTITAVYGR